MTIIATILGGAFVVAQSSSHKVQSSQEHSYALQQVQAQIEAIRSLVPDNDDTLKNYDEGHSFCTYVDATNTIQFKAAGSVQCAGNSPVGYAVTVTKNATGSLTAGSLTRFTVDVSWDKLGGGTNHESLVYGIKL